MDDLICYDSSTSQDVENESTRDTFREESE